jgi:hypothetical protein
MTIFDASAPSTNITKVRTTAGFPTSHTPVKVVLTP